MNIVINKLPRRKVSKRCNKSASYLAMANGYRVCHDCYQLETEQARFAHMPASVLGRCDRPQPRK
jgi:hypothetical protein